MQRGRLAKPTALEEETRGSCVHTEGEGSLSGPLKPESPLRRAWESGMLSQKHCMETTNPRAEWQDSSWGRTVRRLATFRWPPKQRCTRPQHRSCPALHDGLQSEWQRVDDSLLREQYGCPGALPQVDMLASLHLIKFPPNKTFCFKAGVLLSAWNPCTWEALLQASLGYVARTYLKHKPKT